MLSTYARILRRPGAAWFSGSGLVARLPISMLGLGIVFLVEGATGSYGRAGLISGIALLGNAACAVPLGRLIDRRGQGVVLPALVAVWGAALALLMVSVESGWPVAATLLLAVVTGASLPPIGTCVRARWSHALRTQPDALATAFALEAVVDEVVFVIGPILATLLATAWHPVAGLSTALVAGVVGGVVFARLQGTEPPVERHSDLAGLTQPGIPWRTIAPLGVVCAAMGVVFGATEVTTVAFADERGHESWSGALLALWALGSLSAGLVTGALTFRRGPHVRLRWGATGMALTMALLSVVDSIAVLGAALLVGGVAIAPTLISAMSLAEQSLPTGRLTEGMAVLQTGLLAGVAPGAAVAGTVVDGAGASVAYLVAAAGGLMAVLGALLARPASTAPRTSSI